MSDDWQGMIGDAGTSGEVLLALAGRADADPRALAALAVDGARLRQTPALASAIYRNPRAPLSVANALVVTCAREGIVPEGIPGFEELAAAIAADPTALDAAATDSAFEELLQEGPEAAADGEAADGEAPDAGSPDGESSPAVTAAGTPDSGPGGKKPKSRGRRAVSIDFSRLKLYEKIRLATLGNANCRQNLLRDSNRLVSLAAIRSPRITDGEVAKAAGNRSLAEEVIRYIANRKELVKYYAVKLALVGNAKCPLAVALRLLPMLHAEDIKQLARSKNVPGALSVAARRLAAAREPQ